MHTRENLGGESDLVVPVVIVPGAEDLPIPAYMSTGASGMDLRAAVSGDLVLDPGQRALVGTGICIALPEGYEGQVRPRSGLAARDGVTVLNAPGTIDPDYRGEVKVVLINLGQAPVAIKRGDRIAQLIVSAAVRVVLEVSDDLPGTERGGRGFGHTGRE